MWELYFLILGTFLRSLGASAGIIGTLFSGACNMALFLFVDSYGLFVNL